MAKLKYKDFQKNTLTLVESEKFFVVSRQNFDDRNIVNFRCILIFFLVYDF